MASNTPPPVCPGENLVIICIINNVEAHWFYINVEATITRHQKFNLLKSAQDYELFSIYSVIDPRRNETLLQTNIKHIVWSLHASKFGCSDSGSEYQNYTISIAG